MKKRLISYDIVLIGLTVACVALAAAVAWARPSLAPLAALLLAGVAGLCTYDIFRVRHLMDSAARGLDYRSTAGQSSILQLQTPVMLVSEKNIVWYNETFYNNVLHGEDCQLQQASRVLPGLDIAAACAAGGQNLVLDGRRYTSMAARLESGENEEMYVVYFVDDTELKNTADEYKASRPCVLYIVVDTYDEVLRDLKESERALLNSGIEQAMEEAVGGTTGILKRVDAGRYMAVMEERHIDEIIKGRFAVLDKVRAMGSENGAATLSIGVGRGFMTFTEADAMAQQALDMAFGRGGDQAAVRSPEGYEFYGGVSRGVEKRTKVKSRIIASALGDLIGQSSNVLIMGHRNSDLDSLGAAMGIYRLCTMRGTTAAIVLDRQQTLTGPLLARMEAADYPCEILDADSALDRVTATTLLVVVDCHTPNLVESTAVYEACKQVVVIDHHRRLVGYIERAALFYNEPYASSASELVSEMLLYASDKQNRPSALEADGLLAGISLDTLNFTVRTGVRTFEAAAFLRRMGADTASVAQLFNTSPEVYRKRASLVTGAEIYRGCALAFGDSVADGDMSVVVPQAANELLTIEGVLASFVAMPLEGQVVISARSMGAVNVQIIMESLGGGGHHTMAGAQLAGATAAQAREALVKAIDEYYKNSHKKGEE